MVGGGSVRARGVGALTRVSHLALYPSPAGPAPPRMKPVSWCSERAPCQCVWVARTPTHAFKEGRGENLRTLVFV